MSSHQYTSLDGGSEVLHCIRIPNPRVYLPKIQVELSKFSLDQTPSTTSVCARLADLPRTHPLAVLFAGSAALLLVGGTLGLVLLGNGAVGNSQPVEHPFYHVLTSAF